MIRRFIVVAAAVAIAAASQAGPAQAGALPRPPHGHAGLADAGPIRSATQRPRSETEHRRASAGPERIDRAGLQVALDAAVAAGVPGIVYLVRVGDRTTVLTSGTADLATGRPITPQDKFHTASITKTFVSTAVLQLQARGRVDLDAPISRYLPGLLPPAGEAITARQLLGHTSGLFDFAEDPTWWWYYQHEPQRRWRPEDLIRRFSLTHPLTFAPGTDFGYSNTGYLILGLLVEKLTAKPLDRALQDSIFTPFGLVDTTLPTTPGIRGPHAHGYTDFGAGYEDRDRLDPSSTWAAGAIVSTVRDTARFYRLLLSGHILPAAQLAEMTDFRDLGDGSGYGLGLQEQPFPCQRVRGHTGGGLGFATDAESTLDGRRQVVVYATSDSFPEAAYEHFGCAAELTFC